MPDTTTKVADFTVTVSGSMVGLTPVSEHANEWVDQNVEAEGWQWLGNTLWIDHRFAGALLDGVREAGFTLERE